MAADLSPDPHRISRRIFRGVGAAIAIALMELLARLAGIPQLQVPFVASIVLVMALPGTKGAHPRSVIGGHLISALCGLAALWALGPGEVASAVAVGLATLGMLALDMPHPPAGLDAFMIASLALPASWIASPVVVGAVLLAVFARLWNTAETRLFGKAPD